MTAAPWILLVAAAVAMASLALLLPSPRLGRRARSVGALLGVASLGLFASQSSPLGDWLAAGALDVLAGVTLVAAGGTISSHNPIYSALWFGLVLLGTAGLFLLAGAQFLAVATVSVYAGAILVTFLFVLMLAQPEGRAPYDRASTEAVVSAAVGAVLVGLLSVTLGGVLGSPAVEAVAARAAHSRADVLLRGHRMVHFGGELFGRHLLAIEVAGLLLMVALVGAAAVAAHARQSQEGGETTDEHR